MRLRSRQRLRIALAVILCLLFQHVAMAACACTLLSMPFDPVEMAGECSHMGMEAMQEAPALCSEHCSPDRAVVPDPGFAHVPPLALPPLQFAPCLAPPTAHQALAGRLWVNCPEPPLCLRFCRLLI